MYLPFSYKSLYIPSPELVVPPKFSTTSDETPLDTCLAFIYSSSIAPCTSVL